VIASRAILGMLRQGFDSGEIRQRQTSGPPQIRHRQHPAAIQRSATRRRARRRRRNPRENGFTSRPCSPCSRASGLVTFWRHAVGRRERLRRHAAGQSHSHNRRRATALVMPICRAATPRPQGDSKGRAHRYIIGQKIGEAYAQDGAAISSGAGANC